MQMCPGADLSDGLLDVLSIGPAPHWQFPRILASIYSGTHLRFPYLTLTRGQEVVLDADRPVAVYGDGDLIATLPCIITVEPRAVRVLG